MRRKKLSPPIQRPDPENANRTGLCNRLEDLDARTKKFRGDVMRLAAESANIAEDFSQLAADVKKLGL